MVEFSVGPESPKSQVRKAMLALRLVALADELNWTGLNMKDGIGE